MTQMHQPVKIVLVTGYLGAGKTTLLNHVLANDSGVRAAVIVNDIGEVNIDAELLAAGAAQTETVVPLTNGCICCTLADDLAEQLSSLASSGDFDYIVIEASGICEPMPIAYTIAEYCKPAEEGAPPAMALDNIVAVVDCARMIDEFEGGNRMLAGDYRENDVEALLVDQLEFCTTVVLNKTDLVSAGQLGEVRALVRSLQKDAKIVEASQGAVPVQEVLDTGRFDFDDVYRSAAWLGHMAHGDHDHDHHDGHHAHHDHHDHDHHHDHAHHHGPETLEYGIATFVYERRAPFGVEAFSDFAATWPREVIRTKGFAWVDQYPDTQFILEQAGAQRSFTDNGAWGGDPVTRLVFIGRNMDRAAIEARLDACLVDVPENPSASASSVADA